MSERVEPDEPERAPTPEPDRSLPPATERVRALVPERLVPVREAAATYGISRRVLSRAVSTRALASFRVDGWTRVRLSDVEAWLARQRRGAA
jgi:Helix-turn-helix domain